MLPPDADRRGRARSDPRAAGTGWSSPSPGSDRRSPPPTPRASPAAYEAPALYVAPAPSLVRSTRADSTRRPRAASSSARSTVRPLQQLVARERAFPIDDRPDQLVDAFAAERSARSAPSSSSAPRDTPPEPPAPPGRSGGSRRGRRAPRGAGHHTSPANALKISARGVIPGGGCGPARPPRANGRARPRLSVIRRTRR